MPSVIISRNSQFVRVSPLLTKTQIGRSLANDIVLDGTGISRIHAHIENQQDSYYLIDEHSTNGTFVDSQRVQHHQLNNGTSFRIQEYLLTFVEDFQTSVGEPPDGLGTATLIEQSPTETLEPVWSFQQTNRVTSLQQKVSRLLRMINDLSANSNNDSVAALVLDAFFDITGAKRCTMALKQKNAEPVLAHTRGFNGQDQQLSKSKRVIQKVLTDGTIVFRSHFHKTEHTDGDPDLEINSVLCIPLSSGSTVIGCIYLDHPDAPDAFSKIDRDLLTAATDQISNVFLTDDKRHFRKLSYKDEQLVGDLKKQGIIACSPKTIKIFRDCQAIAQYNVSVLVFGETGTGKEVLARFIHDQSGRKGKFIARNCTAIPSPMFESELFGHEKGAFTGAVEQKPGILELAHKGTLFLDEIGDMPFELQAKLLRALQDKEVWRVGGRVPIQTDVRIIAATHKDIKTRRKEMCFRDDLYYRLANVEITAPSLRERPEDIEPLSERILEEFSSVYADKKKPLSLSPKALRLLEAYDWPGNIRELHNTLIQSNFKCDGATIEPRHLKGLIDVFAASSEHGSNSLPSLFEVERDHIIKVLEHTNWNKSAAAKVLSIDRNRLTRRLKALGIQTS